ncbi:N-acetyltransferase [Longispora fulva]|uniref:RimJ/RimL family protein N-acetyltransferase n=1 Tax=Longispora fulva TaxID=619741 RepID=A0A8J7GTA6_9ACTN|nr:GNAT family N-acetyltransferase [Longispora fulva]MBG6138179.1 RimJ/RimL family protein N-acetyltransferase [Longispora fulva]GIG60431.1 N-acetyltransferase [Longispora fulva]
MNIVFSTERLIVRPWEESDADRLFDMYGRMEVVQYLGATPQVMTEPEQALRTMARWRERSTDPRFGIWAVQRPDGVVAGTVLLVPLPDGDGEVEVGWHFHPDSWGHGYATEAARGAVEKGFAEGLDEIFAVVHPPNTASVRVCERLGMTPQGLTDRWYGIELAAFRIARS